MPGVHVLRNKRDFELSVTRGYPWWDGCFKVYFLPREDNIYSRFGIAASRKVGKATRRNLIKRRLREIMRKHVLFDEASKVGDWFIVAKLGAAEVGYAELEAMIIRTRIGVMRKANKANKADCA